jgi:hypothetical protein
MRMMMKFKSQCCLNLIILYCRNPYFAWQLYLLSISTEESSWCVCRYQSCISGYLFAICFCWRVILVCLPLCKLYSLDINFCTNCWECSAVKYFCFSVCSKKLITKLLNAVLWFNLLMTSGLFINWRFLIFHKQISMHM